MKKSNKIKKPVQVEEEVDEMSDFEGVADEESEDDELLKGLHEEDSDDQSSEEDVLGVYSSSESDGENEEDEENYEDNSDIKDSDDDLPDPKAWGKKQRSYYNADHINDKIAHHNEEDEEAAQMEEAEARKIQKRLLSEIDNTDLSFDLLSDVIADKKERLREDDGEKETIEVDLSQMNDKEKLKLLKKESPELLRYIDEYKKHMTCVKDELSPFMDKYKSNPVKPLKIFENFVRNYYLHIMNYCTNISFYVLLKIERADTKSHPVMERLLEYKNGLEGVTKVYNKIVKQRVQEFVACSDPSTLVGKLKLKKRQNGTEIISERTNENFENHEHMEFDEEDGVDETNMEIQEGDYEQDEDKGKRAITYEIAKNKGLTPRRKKELRNPRVKHRMKYRKAKIRRKGQVREVRKEVRKYDGEISGIKASVIKSIKFKA